MEDVQTRLSGRHAWLAGFALWDALFVASFVGGALFVARVDDRDSVARSVALVLLLSQVAWYLLIGRPVIRQDPIGRKNVGYAVVTALTFIGACVAAPASSISLIAVIPLMFWSLRPRHATLAAVGLALVPGVIDAFRLGSLQQAIRSQGLLALALVAGSATLGLWIARIIEQSQERANLVAELADTRAELAKAALRAGVETERTRLAGDIHDAVAQSLNSIVMLSQALNHALTERDLGVGGRSEAHRQVRLIEATAREALAETTALIDELRPPTLGDSVVDALERLASRVQNTTGLAVEVRLAGDPRSLPTTVDVALLRVAQEALSNVARHAGATRSQITLAFDDKSVALTITDDGTGFDTRSSRAGYGIDGIRRRIDASGGQLALHSSDAGTVVHAVVPAPKGAS